MSSISAADSRPLSTREFLDVVKRSGLLSEPQLGDILARVDEQTTEGDPTPLMEQLIHEGILTAFQAGRLFVGNDRGLVIGRYRLLDRIGGGSMGWVFKARHVLMDRIVAIKVISPRCAAGLDALPRFLREMKIVGLLDHPNVVRAFDADIVDDKPYMVMEYVTGENLLELAMRRGVLPPDEVVNHMAQVARGLAHAHEKGVIHRDIKPSNLALDASGVVKILDLGLGAFVSVGGAESSAQDLDRGMAVGTADYMSPEQITGQTLDGRSDLFSLGCTMYYLLTGSHAFMGLERVDRLVKRLHDRHIPLRDVRPNIPYSVVAVVDRLLARDPDDRFADASEAAEALEHLKPFGERSGRPWKPATKDKSAPTPAPLSPEADPKALNWSLIEIELERKTPALPDSKGDSPSQRPPSSRIGSHHKNLEAEGEESGKEIQRQYRAELIQLKREITEKRQLKVEGKPPLDVVRWFEPFLEHLGNYLSEPTAGQTIMIVFLVAVALIALLAVILSLN